MAQILHPSINPYTSLWDIVVCAYLRPCVLPHAFILCLESFLVLPPCSLFDCIPPHPLLALLHSLWSPSLTSSLLTLWLALLHSLWSLCCSPVHMRRTPASGPSNLRFSLPETLCPYVTHMVQSFTSSRTLLGCHLLRD